MLRKWFSKLFFTLACLCGVGIGWDKSRRREGLDKIRDIARIMLAASADKGADDFMVLATYKWMVEEEKRNPRAESDPQKKDELLAMRVCANIITLLENENAKVTDKRTRRSNY